MPGRSPLQRGLLAAAMTLVLATPLAAQETTLTEDIITRLLEALTAEKNESDKVGDQIAEVDAKIAKFNECRELFEAAGSATGKMGGLAAKAAMKAKCGATSVDGYEKDKQKLLEGPEKIALSIMKMKSGQYSQLKSRIAGFLSGGTDGFSSSEASLLDRHRSGLTGLLGSMVVARSSDSRSAGNAGRRSGGGRRMNSNWSSPDYAWEYIGNMFAIMYMSGAPLFEKPYQPGDWTRWQLTQTGAAYDNEPAEKQKTVIERAFLSKAADGNEWWRTTQIDFYQDGGTEKQDTVILEALYKADNEYVKQLVRVRGKFPGKSEPEELMVPQAFAMLSSLSAFGIKPTEESIKGATVGTEQVGRFKANRVKFGGSNGASEWWLADDAPGGWVRFQHVDEKGDAKSPSSYVMELIDHGKGAKSILGVM